MPIEISTQIIHNSYAAVINKIDPKANIYDNPNQQGTAYPAWFIVHRSPVEVMRDFGKRYGGNRYTLTYQIDIWYMIQQNIPRLYDQYTAVAERLDEQLEYLPIFGSDAVVHVYDKSWSLELNSMKYSTTLRLRVCRNNPDYFNEKTIDVITTEMFLKSKFPLLRIYFTNTEHENLNIDMPSQMFCYYGDTFVLPTVEGVYRDEDNLRWSPVRWNIGSFGETIGPLHENVTADLVMEQVIGYDAPACGTVGIGSNTGIDIIVRFADMTLSHDPNYTHEQSLCDSEFVYPISELTLNKHPDYTRVQTLSDFSPMTVGTVAIPQ